MICWCCSSNGAIGVAGVEMRSIASMSGKAGVPMEGMAAADEESAGAAGAGAWRRQTARPDTRIHTTRPQGGVRTKRHAAKGAAAIKRRRPATPTAVGHGEVPEGRYLQAEGNHVLIQARINVGVDGLADQVRFHIELPRRVKENLIAQLFVPEQTTHVGWDARPRTGGHGRRQ